MLKGLLEAGTTVPIVDRCYPLSETAVAIRYNACGKVAFTVDQG